MISPLRLKEMISLADFEENGGRKAREICQYGRSSYIALQLIKSFCFITAADILLIGVYAAGNLENLFAWLPGADLKKTAAGVLAFYIVTAAVYLTGTGFWAGRIYRAAADALRIYEERILLLLEFGDLPEDEEG